jgi:hypothetical protein
MPTLLPFVQSHSLRPNPLSLKQLKSKSWKRKKEEKTKFKEILNLFCTVEKKFDRDDLGLKIFLGGSGIFFLDNKLDGDVVVKVTKSQTQ